MRFWGVAFLCFILVQGCASKKNTPEAALNAYIAAVQAKDAKRTYALLSKDLQKNFHSEEEFAAFFTKYYAEILEEAVRLATQKSDLIIEANLPLQSGAHALLYQSPQGWIVYREAALPKAKSVDDALKGLEQLVRSEANTGPIGFYLSDEAKEERRLRLQAFAELLALVGPYDISEDKTHAIVRLKDGRTLRFYLEDEHWALESLPEELLF
jgi:hypothetical protein